MCVKRILFLILKYLPFQVSYIRKLVSCKESKISPLSIHQVLRIPVVKVQLFSPVNTSQKNKFFIKDSFSKCDQIRRSFQIRLHLVEKSLMKSFTFCARGNFDAFGKPKRNMCMSDIKEFTKEYINQSEISLSFFGIAIFFKRFKMKKKA